MVLILGMVGSVLCAVCIGLVIRLSKINKAYQYMHNRMILKEALEIDGKGIIDRDMLNGMKIALEQNKMGPIVYKISKAEAEKLIEDDDEQIEYEKGLWGIKV